MDGFSGHRRFMEAALEMAEAAFASDETPVGCVLVHDNYIIGRGANDTNQSMNGTRHAEFQALSQVLQTHDLSILRETDLYVTVEPCIMCASALRQYGIRAIYYGCGNDKFGGNGGILSIHSDKNIDKTCWVNGGLFRDEAIMLLRRFYVQENEKAPVPKVKKNRILKADTPNMLASSE